MKVLIFENEFDILEDAFYLSNELYFNSIFEFEVCAKYQDFKNADKINEYALIFVDILLAKKSDLDGFGILETLEKKNIDSRKIIILTGHELLENEFKERNIFRKYEILTKPIEHKKLRTLLEKAIPNIGESE